MLIRCELSDARHNKDSIMNSVTAYTSWPETDLEHLGVCPLCNSQKRHVKYSNLTDDIFQCAPGLWSFWECDSCRVIYLDPRPTPSSVHRAYSAYYTHQMTREEAAIHTLFGGMLYKIQVAIRNSYLRKYLGYQHSYYAPFGWLVYKIFPLRVEITNTTIRHLPYPTGTSQKLLDIGCGNGEFLELARSLGYDAEGLEIDATAQVVASGRGFIVHRGLTPGSGLPVNSYDSVTLSHVLENMHSPIEALKELFHLLKAKGRIWISTPNSMAASHAVLGGNKLLLDAPRHLTLFNVDVLTSHLHRIGFHNIKIMPPSWNDSKNFYCRGWFALHHKDAMNAPLGTIPEEVMAAALSSHRDFSLNNNHAETIVLTAEKI